ncbi:uncharacterized protein DUF1090 [Acinetobacter calcoaceticus]|uniref:Uncharacterized protein DUF1090 n=1 Tax=Acinetobacter calcoaceticus TaxID=471 RepID=A0A4V2R248_ACICA|nr:uncharacterized protein DUF1090 [Acinetobacter calcoaceticus]
MLIRALLLLSVSLFSVQCFAYDAKSCQIKKQKLQQQLEYAKKYNNSYRVRGLERAIADVDRKCAPILKQAAATGK